MKRHLFPLLVSLAAPVSAQQDRAVLDAPLVAVRPEQRIDHLLDWNGDGFMDFVVLYESDTMI